MKKLIWTLSALALAFGMSACGDDPKRTCDHGFKDGCYNGEWLECIFEGENALGEVKGSVKIEVYGTEYTCSDKNVLMPELKCENGMFENGQSVICGVDDTLYKCEGSKTVRGFSYCEDNNAVFCDDGQLVKDACGTNEVCENFVKNDILNAGCFKSENVKTGCEDGLTPYGVCSNDNVLKFCTNDNPELGKTIELKCGESNKTCMLVEESDYGYDCVNVCNDEQGKQLSDRGYCDGSTLHWCEAITEAGVTKYEYKNHNCANEADATSCGFFEEFYDCVVP